MENKDELASKSMHCARCEGKNIESTMEDYCFDYGVGKKQVELTAQVPVRKCVACGYEFLDEEADEAQHEAVCKHLGVMTPRQVSSLRNMYHLSRAQFAKVTALGEATIARWEKAVLIQNCAYDNYLYLLGFRENLKRITTRRSQELWEICRTTERPSFRCIEDTPELRAEQNSFQLHPALEGTVAECIS